mmetsp:Transcript_147207/g.256933  ORF Transcript_147207/g.256933 Transcript_147207/m.256933 type:complete len:361 (-) Transcript_147207:33-1115(-)
MARANAQRSKGNNASGESRNASDKLNAAEKPRKTSVIARGLPALAVILVALASRWWTSGRQATPANPGEAADDRKPPSPALSLWAASGSTIAQQLQVNVSCATGSAPMTGACARPRKSDSCARFVIDDAVPAGHALELKKLVDWLIAEAWGGGAGPPSVIDLHQGSISYKEKFVELKALMDFKSLRFTAEQVESYEMVRKGIRSQLAGLFGVAEEALLHDMTFFSHINASKAAKNIHDEYWHLHTDTEQYGTFAYTALLYLSTEHEEFEGGEFIFEGVDAGSSVAVEPRFNRLVVFTSEAENPHRVQKVTKGVRITLTSAFTCIKEKAASIEPFPKPGYTPLAGDAESSPAEEGAGTESS